MSARALRYRLARRAGAIAICTALIGGLCAAPSALAGTFTQTATIPIAATDWSAAAQVEQFDPSLGSLHDISFGLTGTLQGTIGVESLDPAPSTIAGGISATIALSAPGLGQVQSVSPYVGGIANVAAFDGKIDFAGPSGRTFSGLSTVQSAQTTYTVGAPGPQLPRAPFVGTGTVALPVTASATAGVSGPLDLAAQTRAAAGAAVSVKYGTGAAPPGGGGAFFGSGNIGLINSGTLMLIGIGTQHTPVQVRTLSDQNGNWTRGVAFDPFNSALGKLISVDLTLQGDVKAKLSVQDTGPTSGSYNVLQSTLFSLQRPDGTSLGRSEADFTRSGMLAPFGGTDDFTEPFGTSTSASFLSPPGAFSVSDAPDLALFSGSSPLTLAVDAITGVSAQLPGSADLLSSGVEGAQVSLSYTYLPPGTATYLLTTASPWLAITGGGELVVNASFSGHSPAPPDPVPEPGSLALLSFSLVGFALYRRPR